MSRRFAIHAPKTIRAADSSVTVTQDAQGYKLASSATGGGGASAADHFIVGSGGDADTDLTNRVVIPGLSGSPDVRAGGASDDEFDAFAGWTTLGSLDTSNVTDFKSHYHIKKNTSGTQVDGIYKACPTIPFTFTAKLSGYQFTNSYQTPSILIGEASPGKLETWGIQYTGSVLLQRNAWTDRTTRGSNTNDTSHAEIDSLAPFYLRIVVNSSTNVDFGLSGNGFFYRYAITAYNPGFTVGSVGIGVMAFNAVPCEAVWDWVRFT